MNILLEYLPKIGTAIFIFISFYIVGHILGNIVLSKLGQNNNPSLINLIGRSVKHIFLVFGILTSMGTLGVDVSAIVAGLGLTGFAVGFAMKDILSNMISGILLIVTILILEFVLKRTPYGQSIYAVGGNPEASWLSGISTRLVTGSAYVIFGACVGVGGCITSSQLQAAQAGLDPGMIFDVLTIIVVGGTSLAGGTGAVWRTAVGLAIIATMSNGFIMLGISPYYQDLIKGAIIILALTMSAVAARKG